MSSRSGARLSASGPAVVVLAFLGCGAPPKEAAVVARASPSAAASAATTPAWPPLPTSGFLAGRAATLRDAQEGTAVFVAESNGRSLGTPLAIDVPQYALLVSRKTGRKIRVIVIQAERAAGTDTVGYLDLETGLKGVTTLPEITLLGRKPPE